MKKFYSLVLLFLVFGCSLKNTQRALLEGNYDEVVSKAVYQLQKNKTKKGNQPYIALLEEAYSKANEDDLRTIDYLVREANPQNYQKIFTIYQRLNARQDKIRPLLPLTIKENNRQANFKIEDYSEQIISSKNALVKYLYDNSKALLSTRSKENFRRAYDDLIYLKTLSSTYKDVDDLLSQAKAKGMDYIEVYSNNQTNMVIPQNLLQALLDFNTYGLNEKWVTYHNARQKNISYDYAIDINFVSIGISPEQVKEKEFTVEKEIVDGKIKKLDSRGNVMTDSLGKVIYVDNIKKVSAKVFETIQFKSVQVVAQVEYVNLITNSVFQKFPIQSDFFFENIFAKYKGDSRAVDASYQKYFKNKAVPFPSNEQMVFDTGEDLKAKIKAVIQRNKIIK